MTDSLTWLTRQSGSVLISCSWFSRTSSDPSDVPCGSRWTEPEAVRNELYRYISVSNQGAHIFRPCERVHVRLRSTCVSSPSASNTFWWETHCICAPSQNRPRNHFLPAPACREDVPPPPPPPPHTRVKEQQLPWRYLNTARYLLKDSDAQKRSLKYHYITPSWFSRGLLTYINEGNVKTMNLNVCLQENVRK